MPESISLLKRIFTLLSVLITTFLVSLLLVGLFVTSSILRITLALPAALMLLFSWQKLMRLRQGSNRREQYKTLLSYLLAQASTGHSLIQSLATARTDLAEDYPSRHLFNRILQQTENQVLGNQSAAAVVDQLVKNLNCPEATIGLGILRRLPLSGSALVIYLRRANQSLADLIEINRDIAAQNARTAAEAVILAFMPFGLAFMLNRSGGYFEPALRHPAGTIILSSAFLVSTLALAMIPQAVFPQVQKSGISRQKRRKTKDKIWAGQRYLYLAVGLRQILTRFLGDSWNRQLNEALLRTKGEAVRSRVEYDIQKLNFFIAGLLLGLLLSVGLLQPLLLPIPAIALIFLQDQQLFKQAKQEELHLLASFPYFLQVCVSLLETGLSTHHVLSVTSAAFAETDANKHRTADEQLTANDVLTPMARDARQIKNGLQAGWTIEQVLNQVAKHSITIELRTAYQMLLRYSQLGGVELLQQLLQQAQTCWTVYRNTSRSRTDEQSMRIFVPMMLDLIVILIISLTPAVIMLAAST